MCSLTVNAHTTLADSPTGVFSSSAYLHNEGGQLSLSEVVHSFDWQKHDHLRSLGFMPGATWFRFTLSPDNAGTYLSIKNQWLQNVQLYFATINSTQSPTATGLESIHAATSISENLLTFRFPNEQTPSHVYLRVTGSIPLLVPVVIQSESAFFENTQFLNLSLGLFYGLILIAILGSLLLYFATHRVAYFSGFAYTITLSLVLLSIDGTGPKFLWGLQSELQVYLPTAMIGLAAAINCIMSTTMLSLKTHAPTAHKSLVFLCILSSIISAACILYPISATPLLVPLLMLCLAVILFAAILRAQQGSVFALLYIASHVIFSLGVLSYAALQYGYLNHNIWSSHALHIAAIFEFLFLSAAIGYNFRKNAHRSSSLQQRTLDLAKRVQTLQTQSQRAEGHRQVQRALQSAHRLKSIGQMSGGFAHEFNNILASILGFTELSKGRADKENDTIMQEYLAEIERSGLRGSQLVKQLLIYSRGGQTEPQTILLEKEIREICEMLNASFPDSAKINVECSAPDLKVRIDPTQLRQMLVNLALNAMEAMQERGPINLTLQKRYIDETQCTSCMAIFSGDYLALEVQDQGPGITGNPAELFTPFQTSKTVTRGAGLGLSVVHGIAHENGGHLSVSNCHPTGACFSIFLPEHTKGKVVTKKSQRSILVIDDDSSVALFLEALLRKHNYHVAIAKDPTKALERFVHNPDEFDLIITDQLMPHLTGLELAQDFLALRPDIPIILCSANVPALDPTQISTSGIQSVFAKPINVELLLTRVHGLLETSKLKPAV
ncbi:MAG: response regulator [Pseudomonadales bacterium]|nr:response regulator [Pseudomonadales bacterium]